MEPIILVGGGGHCLSCIDVILQTNRYEIVGILDTADKVGTLISGVKVIGTDSDIWALSVKYKNFMITVGQIKSFDIRIRIYNSIKEYGGNLPVIISPSAYVSPSAIINEGSIIMHNALVNAKAEIGKNCIINTGALIEHEVFVGDFCHVSTHAVLNGQVRLGKKSFIGSNAVIANNVSLPEEIIISAGACVLRSPEKKGIYIGNPARKSDRS